MNSHSPFETGITESRLPRRTSGRAASSGNGFSSDSGIVRPSRRPKRTSTRYQRGLSGSLAGSKCLSAGVEGGGVRVRGRRDLHDPDDAGDLAARVIEERLVPGLHLVPDHVPGLVVADPVPRFGAACLEVVDPELGRFGLHQPVRHAPPLPVPIPVFALRGCRGGFVALEPNGSDWGLVRSLRRPARGPACTTAPRARPESARNIGSRDFGPLTRTAEGGGLVYRGRR